jgi:peptidoglycan-N-acetylglucosamine deacetylase
VIRDRHGINSKLVALTFDDGPSEWTEPILDYLQAAGAYATFFVLGAALEGREAVVRRAAAENHGLGVHTYSHPDLCASTAGEVRSEIARTATALGEIVQAPARFWRAPFFSVGRTSWPACLSDRLL